jgi:hypothetical protein
VDDPALMAYIPGNNLTTTYGVSTGAFYWPGGTNAFLSIHATNNGTGGSAGINFSIAGSFDLLTTNLNQ